MTALTSFDPLSTSSLFEASIAHLMTGLRVTDYDISWILLKINFIDVFGRCDRLPSSLMPNFGINLEKDEDFKCFFMDKVIFLQNS